MAGSKNEMDAFERKVKESLAQYEVPFNSADWVQMERALASGVHGWGHGRAIMVGLLLAGGLLIGGTAYFLGRDTEKQMVSGSLPTKVDLTTASTSALIPTSVSSTVKPSSLQESGALQTAQLVVPDKTERPAAVESPKAAKPLIARSAPSAPALATVPTAAPKSPPNDAAGTVTIFRASVKDACPGSPVDFTVEHMPEDGIYLWNFGDGSFSNKPNPQHTFTKAGNYQVMLSMSSVGAGTIRNKPSSDMIVIHEAPSAAFNMEKQEYAGQIPSMHFENRSQGAKSYQWDLGDGSVSTQAHPDHVYKVKGTYQVELTVTNETGCVDRKMKEIRVERDFNLGAPASFSPNGDGVEETFMPQALLDLTAKFQLAVYDTAGNLLYSTSDPTHPWCGKAKNQGSVCAKGEYVWVVDIESGAQAAETFTGKVKLLP